MSIRWSLQQTTPYTASTALQGVLYMTSPVTTQITGYVLGTLLTETGAPISELLFHVAWDEQQQRAVVVAGWVNPYRWSIPPPPIGGYAVAAPFTFAFSLSDVWLRLVLYEMAGPAPDPGTDPILGQVMTWLSTPPSILDQVMPLIGMALGLGMLAAVVREVE